MGVRAVVKIFEKMRHGIVGGNGFFHYEFTAFAGPLGWEGLIMLVV
jgi:hypothetical protein